MHIDGVKKLISIRGGIDEVKRTNPLTARMVAWYVLLPEPHELQAIC